MDDYVDSRHARSCLGYCAFVALLLIVTLAFFLAFIYFINPTQKEAIKKAPQAVYQKIAQISNKIGQREEKKCRQPVAILMYHYIREVEDREKDALGFSLSVSPADFEKQMEYLAKNKYTVIDFQKFLDCKIGERSVILTFDDGYEDFFLNAKPVLEKYQFPATSYIITSRIGKDGYLNENQLKDLSTNPLFNLGSHTATHPNFSTASYENQVKELMSSAQELRHITGKNPVDFCYPSGHFSLEGIDTLKEYNFQTAVTIEEGLASQNNNWLALPRIRVSGSMGVKGFEKKLSELFNSQQASAP